MITDFFFIINNKIIAAENLLKFELVPKLHIDFISGFNLFLMSKTKTGRKN